MAGKAEGGKGNAQISVPTKGGNAKIRKMGQTEGKKYGMNSAVKSGK